MERLVISGKREATATEKSVALAFSQIQESSESFKTALKGVEIKSVKEVKDAGNQVLVITVPYKQIAGLKPVIPTLLAELEKKLSSTPIIVGAHRAFPKTPEHGRRYKAIRPYGRTLRAVNDAILEDVCYPTTIVGKHVHYDLQGKQTTKVTLDANDVSRVEHKLGAFSAAFNRLTGIHTVFEVARQ